MAVTRTILPRKGLVQPQHGLTGYEADQDANWLLLDANVAFLSDVETPQTTTSGSTAWSRDSRSRLRRASRPAWPAASSSRKAGVTRPPPLRSRPQRRPTPRITSFIIRRAAFITRPGQQARTRVTRWSEKLSPAPRPSR